MNPQDAIQLSIASAVVGAALVTVIYILAIMVRDARAANYRRKNYVEGRTILHRI